ncbi:Vacuolar import and degradation protein 27 [Spathaspora sp. JA1]|nr:Vacuolar import and degradation protein 27 [Spathaspora sp. JA1]
MNFIRKFIGATPTDEVASIPSGKLYLTRSKQSPKGSIECLYNDAFASIKQTTTPFYYQFFINRVYQEGELDATSNSASEGDDDDESTNSRKDIHHSKDEWVFPLEQDLNIYIYQKTNGSKAIVWKDLNGDLGDKFEFIIDEDVRFNEVDSFMFTIYKCLYENKYRTSSLRINNLEDLKEFIYNPKQDSLGLEDLQEDGDFEDEEDEEEEEEEELDEVYFQGRENQNDHSRIVKYVDNEKSQSDDDLHYSSVSEPQGKIEYVSTNISLHLYDPSIETFISKLDTPNVEVKLIGLGTFENTLFIHSLDPSKRIRINVTLNRSMSPTFNYQHLSFIFNNYTANSQGEISGYSWLIKFPTFNDLSYFQRIFLGLMYESLNKKKWGERAEQDYFINAFSELRVDEAGDLTAEDKKELFVEESDEEEDEYESAEDFEKRKIITQYENLDSDEDEDYEKAWKNSKDKNTDLTVGLSKGRSYVVKGDNLGVYNEGDKRLYFQTAISNLSDLKGKKFNPDKLLLHQQDQHMIMSDSKFNDKTLYKMDLTRGKVVEEWKISNDVPIVSYAPKSKFSQLTDEQTITGISSNGLFTIDPRLPGNKLVNDQTYKQYKTKNNDFTTLATTENGYIALGSGKGDIKLYDRLGVNAKTALPSFGDPVVGLDVSKDGRWMLVTCDNYLLLTDLKIGAGQKNEGKLGFTNYFDKDKKPIPRRLILKPQHEAYITRENGGKQLKFTQAYFNTGLDTKEMSIVVGLGNYLITWSMSKVLRNDPDPYLIRKFSQNIVADNFKFGSNNEVIMATQDDVSMISKRKLNKPNSVFR